MKDARDSADYTMSLTLTLCVLFLIAGSHAQIYRQCSGNNTVCCPKDVCSVQNDCTSVTSLEPKKHQLETDQATLSKFYPFLQFSKICCPKSNYQLCAAGFAGPLTFRRDFRSYLTNDIIHLNKNLMEGETTVMKNVVLNGDEHLTVNEYFSSLHSKLRQAIRDTKDTNFIQLTALVYANRFIVRYYETILQSFVYDPATFSLPFNAWGTLPTSPNSTLDFQAFFDSGKTLNDTALLLSKALLHSTECKHIRTECWWQQAITVDMWLDAWSQYYARHYNPFYTGKVRASTLRVWVPFSERPLSVGQLFSTGAFNVYYIFPKFIQVHVQKVLTDSLMPVYLCGLFVAIVIVSLMWNECLYCPSFRRSQTKA